MKNNNPPTLTPADIKLLEEKFVTKDDLIGLVHVTEMDQRFDELRKEMNYKFDKLFNILDKLVGEMKTYREEQAITSYRIKNHENRITNLESTTTN